ncbi:hypothetical protein [Amycolatopsis sp. NBC_00438]|uniref:hypothetical protein n=1 Tax=Amycolatopsis sp. NBC_00438 TaxID=2903558 RepID=UPI002E1E03AE
MMVKKISAKIGATITAFVGAGVLLLATSAPAAASPATAATASSMATDGCDGTGLPPSNTTVYYNSYDPWLGWNACTQCNWDADLLATFGYATYCWETVSNGQRAELWIG